MEIGAVIKSVKRVPVRVGDPPFEHLGGWETTIVLEVVDEDWALLRHIVEPGAVLIRPAKLAEDGRVEPA